MQDILHSIILGIVQGVTEFLPVSSSGHLVLLQKFLPPAGNPLFFDIVLHSGTLLAVMVFSREELELLVRDTVRFRPPGGRGGWRGIRKEYPGLYLLFLIAVSSIPTAMIGLSFRATFASLFESPGTLWITFLITAILLFLTRFGASRRMGLGDINYLHALLLGMAQGLAITPGISRSGATVACALFLGMRRDLSVKYSMVMSIPAVIGALILEGRAGVETGNIPASLAGGITAAITGYLALMALLRVVRKGKLHLFSPYLLFVSLFSLVLTLSG